MKKNKTLESKLKKKKKTSDKKRTSHDIVNFLRHPVLRLTFTIHSDPPCIDKRMRQKFKKHSVSHVTSWMFDLTRFRNFWTHLYVGWPPLMFLSHSVLANRWVSFLNHAVSHKTRLQGILTHPVLINGCFKFFEALCITGSVLCIGLDKILRFLRHPVQRLISLHDFESPCTASDILWCLWATLYS